MATHVIVGLGNPGTEYTGTRHNTGRMAVERLHATHDFGEWKAEKKPPMMTAKGNIEGKKIILVAPNTFMNNSGRAVAHFVKNKKNAGNTIIIYDDLDVPLGVVKISYGRSSGGHNGLESVIKSLKTRDFVRIRVGISPKGSKGMANKPSSKERVLKYILGKFSLTELVEFKKVLKRVVEAVEMIVVRGHQDAMTAVNTNSL